MTNHHVRSGRILKPLVVGENVSIQNQTGNKPKRWSNTGKVVEVLPHRQYRVMINGSKRLTLRNRKFLRRISPTSLYKPSPSPSHIKHPETTLQLQHPGQPPDQDKRIDTEASNPSPIPASQSSESPSRTSNKCDEQLQPHTRQQPPRPSLPIEQILPSPPSATTHTQPTTPIDMQMPEEIPVSTNPQMLANQQPRDTTIPENPPTPQISPDRPKQKPPEAPRRSKRQTRKPQRYIEEL